MSNVMIFVHKRIQILEMLNAVTCIKIGLDSRPCMQESVALSANVEQVESRLSLVAPVCSRSGKKGERAPK
jgi:hypothetical protein